MTQSKVRHGNVYIVIIIYEARISDKTATHTRAPQFKPSLLHNEIPKCLRQRLGTKMALRGTRAGGFPSMCKQMP